MAEDRVCATPVHVPLPIYDKHAAMASFVPLLLHCASMPLYFLIFCSGILIYLKAVHDC